jgi:hypothetical protein
MHTRSKLLLAALTSALLLAMAVGSASAARLGSNETAFRIVYAPLSFVPSFGSTARCPVTLAGSFHSRTITKEAGSLIGYVNSVTVGTCEAGRARANTETLPWHIRYVSFTGSLPNIATITQLLNNSSFEVQGEIFGLRVTCRYNVPSKLGINTRETTRGVVTGQTPGGESDASATGGCPSGRLTGTASVLTGGGAPLVVTLV